MEINKKRQKISKAFKVALEGILYTFKYRSVIRIQYILIVIMIIGSFKFDLSKVENLLLVFAVSLVIVSEMVNTAVEKTIDMMTDEQTEYVKIAKDVASGGTIIATLNAVIATCVIFFDKLIK